MPPADIDQHQHSPRRSRGCASPSGPVCSAWRGARRTHCTHARAPLHARASTRAPPRALNARLRRRVSLCHSRLTDHAHRHAPPPPLARTSPTFAGGPNGAPNHHNEHQKEAQGELRLYFTCSALALSPSQSRHPHPHNLTLRPSASPSRSPSPSASASPSAPSLALSLALGPAAALSALSLALTSPCATPASRHLGSGPALPTVGEGADRTPPWLCGSEGPSPLLRRPRR